MGNNGKWNQYFLQNVETNILCTHIFDSSFNNAPRIRKILYNKKVLDYTYLLSTKIQKKEKDTHR